MPRDDAERPPTLTRPVTVMFPLALTTPWSSSGFTRMGWMGSPRETELGTVLSMRSRSWLQVAAKNSLEAAIFPMRSPPSAVKIRASERVLMLWPKARAFCDTLATNWVALETQSS